MDENADIVDRNNKNNVCWMDDVKRRDRSAVCEENRTKAKR